MNHLRLKSTHLQTVLRPASVSSLHGFTTSSYGSRRQDEYLRSVRVLVWWDLESCQVPAGVNALKVAHMVTSAVRANGIKGPLQITAFGDIFHLTRATQEAFSYTGINLAHVPRGGKNSADRSIIVDIMHWASQNPPPAHLFLISGDRDLSSILHRLRMNNYNILLASPDSASTALCSAASIMWHWNALINGDNLTGRRFNLPPDGPYGSWYGHDHVPLEDPFSVELLPCAPAEELPEAASDSKVRPVPKAVIKHIQDILTDHPKGISITDLRAELNIDKDFYGYKKFSRFLASLSQILRLQTGHDGQLHVRKITPKAAESPNTNPSLVAEPACKSGGQEVPVSSKSDENVPLKVKLVRHPNLALNTEATQVNFQAELQDRNKLVKTDAERTRSNVSGSLSVSDKIDKKANEQLARGLPAQNLESVSVPEEALPGKVELMNPNGNGRNADSSSEKIDADKKHSVETNSAANQLLESTPDGQSAAAKKISDGLGDKKPEKGAGFLGQIFKWFRFWRHEQDQDGDILGTPRMNMPNKRDVTCQVNEIFTEDSFWNNIKHFMGSPKALSLVSQSRSREEMGEKLLKEGPLALKSLTNSELLRFIDLLITNKKWVEECSMQVFPFTVKMTIEKTSESGHPQIEHGLLSVFKDRSDKNSQQQPYREKQSLSIPETAAPANSSIKRSVERSRSEIIADCQKLVKDILREHPQGYHIVSFRSLFLQRYGYPLSTQKLGYNKLSSLLEIMPGVKIESNYLLPLNTSPDTDTCVPEIQENTFWDSANNSNGESSGAAKRESNHESPWDELGPISSSSSSRKMSRVVEEPSGQPSPDYEPCLSEDELSDMDEKECKQGKVEGDEEDSSLLQLLDSYYGSKGSCKGKKSGQEVDSCASDVKLSGVSSKMSEGCLDNKPRQKPYKRYSFVEEDNDKVVESILGSLKKSGESKMHS